MLTDRRLPHVSPRHERWILDCERGTNHQRLNPLDRKQTWVAGATRTFELCSHCQTWVERTYSWKDLLADSDLRSSPVGR